MIWRSVATASRLYVGFRPLHQSSRLSVEALRDEAIKARYVRLVDPETGSLSDQAQRVQNLLRKMDRTRFWLIQVKGGKLDQEERIAAESSSSSSGSKGNAAWTQPQLDQKRSSERLRERIESEMDLEDLAIVKMIDKKEEYNRQREKKLEKKKQGARLSAGSSTSAHKEVDMTWSSTSHDIEHKLKTLLTHFKKKGPGARGTVSVKAKSGKGRHGGMEDSGKNELVQKIEDYLCNWVEHSEEVEPLESLNFHARRAGEVDWKAEKSFATIRFEVVKGRKPKT